MKLPTDEKEKLEFLKYLYDYCVSANWNKEKMEQLAKQLDTNIGYIKRYAIEYAYKIMSRNEVKQLEAKIREIRKKEKEVSVPSLSKINPILYQTKGKNTTKLWEDEDDKQIVLKTIYNFCEENNYDANKIKEYAKWLGANINTITISAKEYATKYLGLTLEEYSDKRVQHAVIKSKQIAKQNSNIANAYEKLLKANNLEEIKSIIENSNIEITRLSKDVADFVNSYKNGDELIKQLLVKKMNIYKEYLNKQITVQKEKEKNELLPIANNIVEKFINSNEIIPVFCKNNNINKATFNKYLNLIKEKNPPLYNSYIKKITEIQKKWYSYKVKQIRQIISGLKNGIEINGQTKKFDLIDYYSITKTSINEMLQIAKDNVTQKDFDLFNKFAKQNERNTETNTKDINQIMNQKIIISYEKDKNNEPIPGTEVIVSNEDKQKVINYLRYKKIPINLKTYSLMYKRYINGELEIKQDKHK